MTLVLNFVVLHFLLLCLPLLVRSELLHLMVASVLLLSNCVHFLRLSHGLPDLLVHSLLLFLKDFNTIFDQHCLLIHCLSLIHLIEKGALRSYIDLIEGSDIGRVKQCLRIQFVDVFAHETTFELHERVVFSRGDIDWAFVDLGETS